MHAVDTNVLVRLLTRDHEAQAHAADLFVEGGAWVSHLVLAETSWVLAAVYKRSPSQLADALTQLLEHETLVVQDEDVVSAALQKFRSQSRIGFSDCLILEIARKAGHTPLGTFDVALARLDGAQQLKA